MNGVAGAHAGSWGRSLSRVVPTTPATKSLLTEDDHVLVSRLRRSEWAASEITCREVAEWTSAYLDACAGNDRNARIALHLAVCAGCEAYVKHIASVRRLVGLLPKAPEAPADLDGLRGAFVARHRKQ